MAVFRGIAVRRAFSLALLALAASAAGAADEPAPVEATTPVPPAPAAPAEPAPAPETTAASAWKWEGAIGPLMTLSPEYSGSASRHTVVVPGFYLRYGRISISNVSGFVTRRNKDDVFRGLGVDLKSEDDALRLNVALRIDGGRKSSESSGLTGIQDVRRTLRARTSATWELGHGWKVAAGWGADLLGRGGGNTLDFGAGHDRRLTDKTTWSISAGVSMADSRYMRSYYGIDEAESAATALPLYRPGAGLREMNLSTGWRSEFDPKWVALWGGSVSRLLGPAAQSPLTTSTRQWSVNAGIARRF